MLVPETYHAALFLMMVTMLCWGSWANILKLCPNYRFQLFYWDYALGLVAGSLVWGMTGGSLGHAGLPFFADVAQAGLEPVVYAALGGAVFNIANLLLVAAIEVAGLAVAFPVGIGLALIIGAVSSYLISPAGNPLLLFGGVLLVTVAIVVDAAAYRQRERSATQASVRGIVLSLVAGALMGTFFPLVTRAMHSAHAPGPYAIAFFFAIGAFLCNAPSNLFLMRHPLDGKPPVSGAGYWRAPWGWHLAGLAGGLIWTSGTISNFIASGTHLVGPAVSYAIGQGATMVSACWGVFVWREFASAPRSARRLLPLMFAFFLLGLGAVALAPLY